MAWERYACKLAIVTGGSVGIGGAIVENLVGHGMQVLAIDIPSRKPDLDKLGEKLKTADGQFHQAIGDVRDEKAMIKIFDEACTQIGPLQVLVNNAGVLNNSSLMNGKLEDWEATMRINVLGLCTCTREGVKNMIKNNVKGHVFHINSILGHSISNLPVNHLYTPSKHAITALTKSLRIELHAAKAKIKVTSVSPGVVETFLFDPYPKEQRLPNIVPALKPADIASAVEYALSVPEHCQVEEVTVAPLSSFI